MTEALKLRQTSKLATDEERFVGAGLSLVMERRVEEVPCPVEEICSDPDRLALACRMGLPDASVLLLAAKKRCLLLTDDRPMFQSSAAGFEIRLLDEYLRSA
ncbi:MAG: hypothetical protein GY953_55070 [bacterium]|nr:hypothetical protein [bacterium]